MGILSNLKSDSTIKGEADNLGGGFAPLDSALYDFTIELAFITIAPSEAVALNLHLATNNGKKLRQQLWMTSNKAKGCLNYYINKKSGEKCYLPGFNQANALCLLTIGKEISAATTEIKVINLYDHTVKKDVPTKVEMLTELLGKQVTAGVIKQNVDKTAKNAQTGTYDPTGEIKVENEIDKLFRFKDGMTVPEIRAKSTEALFKGQWAEKWEGQVKDKTTKATGVANGAPYIPPAAGASAQPSLFA